MSRQPSGEKPWKALFLVSAISIDFAVCVTVGTFAGRWLSGVFGGSPIWIVLGLVFGIGAGAASVFFLVKPFITEGKNE